VPLQIEQYEYEIEELAANLKKKAKPPPKLVALEEVVTVHKKHTIQLEKALRCLDNDAISSEDIDPLKEELEYYLVRRGVDGLGASNGGVEHLNVVGGSNSEVPASKGCASLSGDHDPCSLMIFTRENDLSS
jgi:CCR4-NOT transcription complex subunit 3